MAPMPLWPPHLAPVWRCASLAAEAGPPPRSGPGTAPHDGTGQIAATDRPVDQRAQFTDACHGIRIASVLLEQLTVKLAYMVILVRAVVRLQIPAVLGTAR